MILIRHFVKRLMQKGSKRIKRTTQLETSYKLMTLDNLKHRHSQSICQGLLLYRIHVSFLISFALQQLGISRILFSFKTLKEMPIK